jgi:hypothetical protein
MQPGMKERKDNKSKAKLRKEGAQTPSRLGRRRFFLLSERVLLCSRASFAKWRTGHKKLSISPKHTWLFFSASSFSQSLMANKPSGSQQKKERKKQRDTQPNTTHKPHFHLFIPSHPVNLSISFTGGKEIKRDVPSNGE